MARWLHRRAGPEAVLARVLVLEVAVVGLGDAFLSRWTGPELAACPRGG